METMTFGKAISTCWKKYAVFNGRARRAEFWYWTLFVFLVSIGISALQGLCYLPQLLRGTVSPTLTTAFSVISCVWVLVTLLPSLSVSVRRLHDTTHSGWWLFAGYILEVVSLALVLSQLYPYILADATPDLSEINILPFAIGCALYLLVIPWAIVILVWYCTKSTSTDNKYGPLP